MTTMTAENAPSDGKITCHVDGKRVHSIQIHLRDNHPEWTVERYKTEFPGQPLLSDFAAKKLAAKKSAEVAPLKANLMSEAVTKKALHEVFDLGAAPAAKNARGEPIMISIFGDHSEESQAFVPDIDERYIFNIDLTKTIIIGLQLNKPIYLWGYHGTGKTTSLEQVAGRTGRPFMRIQHTINTEESHIIGQYTVKNGETVFNLGPLGLAMINGWIYCADEYDAALPSVSMVYQPVLEGKPLLIKDAPPEFRVIRPHRDFRFVATGNTNGSGDETGLYQGTQIQNAANYSRFAIVEEVGYMEPKQEAAVVAGQGGIDKKDAERFVKFAKDIREAFAAGRIGMTVSPRELINSAQLGLVRGSDWKAGLKLGLINRASRVDKVVMEEFAQRIFG